jgi:hypothetical protein
MEHWLNLADGEIVQVRYGDRWLQAHFVPAHGIRCSGGSRRHVWWTDHFIIEESGEDLPLTLPEDLQGGDLPDWRRPR